MNDRALAPRSRLAALGWETESASADFPDGLRVLGEVIPVTTRAQVLAGRGLMKGWREKLISVGYADQDIVDSSPSSSGDLAEVELTRTSNGALVGIAVHRKWGNWSPCQDAFLNREGASAALSTIAGIGPPRANWIECDPVVERDGWIRRAIPAAPASGSSPVSVWVKFPERPR